MLAEALETSGSNIDLASLESEPILKKEFLGIGNTHQPHRRTLLPTSGERVLVFPEINRQISDECYKRIFVRRSMANGETEDFIPNATAFSLSASLRDWMMDEEPEVFEQIKANVDKLPDKEYRILGDSYIHTILPLLPEEDQDTLVKTGLDAFEQDLGFKPKGFWAPETAISSTTMRVLFKNGYKFVVLAENQLKGVDEKSPNPVYVPILDGERIIGEMAVIHFSNHESTNIAFDDSHTQNADEYLRYAKRDPRRTIVVATDTELYGHLEGGPSRGKVEFLSHLTKPSTLEAQGYKALDIKTALEKGGKTYTEVKDYTSWSCGHDLRRWKGECECGEKGKRPSPTRLNEKRWLFATLSQYGTTINAMLSRQNPSWRDGFPSFFLSIRKAMFTSNGQLKGNEDPLSIAKACQFIGFTSCGWFFPEDDRPETRLNHAMNTEIYNILQGLQQYKPLAMAA